MVIKKLFFLFTLLILGACASKMKDQLKEYREAYSRGEFEKAKRIFDNSVFKDDKKSILLWKLEQGTLALAMENEDLAIQEFQEALDLIDKLYTTSLSSKTASFLINDMSDDFYGASYERSYAHYFLAKSLYQRYQKTGNKLDLQGARGTILAWDSFFTDLQRSASKKTLYSTDLMLKIFGAQIHEASEIKNDLQIALQLYKDALGILKTQGGIYSVFNKKNTDYIKSYENEGKLPPQKLFEPTLMEEDLKEFIQFKILSLTKEVRGSDFDNQVKALGAKEEIVKEAKKGKGNVVLVLEEGLIPQKVGKPFNFGLKGAVNAVDNPGAKSFIAGVGAEVVTAFAMNKLGMIPEKTASPGSFVFAHSVTKLAVTEAAVEFELPMIENVPLVQRLGFFILDENGVVKKKGNLPVISENGDIARVVLEEDVVSRYIKTGTRVATKHLVAIVAAMKVYQSLNKGNDSGDFLAKTAAMATYVGASKGIAAMEKADIRAWNTLPQAFRMTEVKLPPGKYQLALGIYDGNNFPTTPSKIVGKFEVLGKEKNLHIFKFNP